MKNDTFEQIALDILNDDFDGDWREWKSATDFVLAEYFIDIVNIFSSYKYDKNLTSEQNLRERISIIQQFLEESLTSLAKTQNSITGRAIE